MSEKLRRSGIDIINDVPWGTHFCQFYRTKEDLLDILLPYFKAGLENNEFCMWITSEPLSDQEALEAIRKSIPGSDRYLANGQIEILPHSEWYLEAGRFSSGRVLGGWVEKLNEALVRGYEGLRLSGNTFWLEREEWRDFLAYEEEVNNIVGKYPMIAMCTYSLDKCGSADVLEVVNTHQFALSMRDGKWDLVESAEHRRAVEALKESEARYRSLFENMINGFAYHQIITDERGWPVDYVFLEVNKAFERLTGLEGPNIVGKGVREVLPGIEHDPADWICVYGKVALGGKEIRFEQYAEPLGKWYSVLAYSPMQGFFVTIFEDITDRKRTEEALREAHAELEAKVSQRTTELEKTVDAVLSETAERERAERALIEQSKIIDAFFKHAMASFVILDRNFNFVRVNDAYARACSRDASEFPGNNHFELYPSTELQEHFEHSVETKEPFSIMARPFTFPDHPEWGVTYWDLALVPLLDERGEVEYLFFSLNDVTQRMRVKQQLRESRQKLLDTLASISDAFFTLDREWRFTYVNNEAVKILGMPRENLIGRNIWGVSPRAIGSIFDKQFRRAMAEQVPVSFEARSPLLNIWVEARAYPSHDGLSVYFLDVSERKEYEQRILASNRLLQLLGTAASRREYLDEVVKLVSDWSGCRCVGIRVVDDNGMVPYESYVGFSREFWELESCLILGRDQCACTRVIARRPDPQDVPAMTAFGSFCCGNTITFAAALTGKDRTRYRGACERSGFMSVAVVPVSYKDRVIAAVHLADEEVGMVPRSIIEFFETMTPLIGEAIHKFDSEAERARLAAAVESAADAIVMTDPRGTIQYVNPAFEKTTGYARDEAEGRDLHILDSGKHGHSFYQGLRESIGRNGVWTGRLTNRKKDGTLYEEECSCSLVRGPEGEIINYVSVKRDVTERLKLESIAQAVDTMNNIGYIFAGVRHEIGNPINSAAMALSVLKAKLDTCDKPTILKYIDRALEGTDRVIYLLRSLRSFNFYEKPEIRTVETADFLEKFLLLVKEDFEKMGITIGASVEGGAEQMLVDPRALQQVMLNIVTNAADALKGIEHPKIIVLASKMAGAVRMRVQDNGCGMPEEQLKDLFKPFHTTKAHGTGLGLVIVKKMLAMMNGTLELSSHLDQGTTVDIFIPAGTALP